MYCFIVVGGVMGVCLWYFVIIMVDFLFGKYMLFGILVVNVIGLFLLVLFYGFIECYDLSDLFYRVLIGVGLLGVFIMFFMFLVEILMLLENGLWLKVIVNVFFNVGVCLLVGWLVIELMKG